MADYDVIVIGGGINGLTCAAYLGKAGLKTLLLEARGECGAHCDTAETNIPGFLHNLHTTWLVTAMSPAMAELELERFGLELRTTDVIYAKTFGDRKNALICNNPFDTIQNWEKLSPRDAGVIRMATETFLPRIMDLIDVFHRYMFTAPKLQTLDDLDAIYTPFFKQIGMNTTFKQIYEMNGFETMNRMFESEHIKTMLQSLSWISGLSPIHPKVGSSGTALLGPLTGPVVPVHLCKGGGHSLTHALVKAATAYGVKILPCCPVQTILMENGKAAGVKLSDHAVFSSETFTARTVVSNVTVVPTFIQMIGEDHIGTEMAARIKAFSYEEQNIIGVYYALSGRPQFASADFDEGIQRSCMGYFGGETSSEMETYARNLVNRTIHDKAIGNWFIPTLADPSQAPEGCHTSFVWFDVPPTPEKWKDETIKGFMDWRRIKERVADMITDTYEQYAPGFKNLILDRTIYSPLDMYRNNPSAVKGNWAGGSVIPEQFYENRPVPGVTVNGASRTFLPNLYLSNSIHPFGSSNLASGYIAACEVAADMGVRDQGWWNEKACMWLLANAARIPSNLGVGRAS